MVSVAASVVGVTGRLLMAGMLLVVAIAYSVETIKTCTPDKLEGITVKSYVCLKMQDKNRRLQDQEKGRGRSTRRRKR